MQNSIGFVLTCLAMLAAAAFTFPQTPIKNEETNEIPQTDDAIKRPQDPLLAMTTASAPPTTLTVAAVSDTTTESSTHDATSTTSTDPVSTTTAPSTTSTSPTDSTTTTTSTPATTTTTRKPSTTIQNPISGFARLIDDIFQIPISVLQAVNTLFFNSFRSRTPQN